MNIYQITVKDLHMNIVRAFSTENEKEIQQTYSELRFTQVMFVDSKDGSDFDGYFQNPNGAL
jgi:hypothetical protein